MLLETDGFWRTE